MKKMKLINVIYDFFGTKYIGTKNIINIILKI